MELTYTNKKGKAVEVRATPHALRRFSQRYYKINPSCKAKPEEQFETLLRKARPMDISTTKKYKRRNKRNGGSTVYLKTDGITFVVENQVIKTVEISAKDLRHLN